MQLFPFLRYAEFNNNYDPFCKSSHQITRTFLNFDGVDTDLRFYKTIEFAINSYVCGYITPQDNL